MKKKRIKNGCQVDGRQTAAVLQQQETLGGGMAEMNGKCGCGGME